MASIDDLKGVISSKNGVARSNLFNVILPVYTKAGLRISSASTPYEMNILCRDVNLPGRQTLTRDRVYGLQRRKIAYGFAQEEISLNFLLLGHGPWRDQPEAVFAVLRRFITAAQK